MEYGRYYEELEVGTVYRHWPGRTVSEYDNTQPDRGIVAIETRAYDQRQERILVLRRKYLAPKRGNL